MKKNLTDRTIIALKPAAKQYEISDAVVPGLVIRVTPTGGKSFNLIARYPGSSNPARRSLGTYGKITLQKARDKARAWHELLGRGIDPADEIRRERDEAASKRHDTVAVVAERYLTRYVPSLRSSDRIIYNFRDVLIPLFGHRPITELTWKEVSPVLDEIAQHGTDCALVKLGVRKQLRRRNRRPKPAPVVARNLFCYLDGLLRWAAGTDEYDIEFSPLARVNKAKRFGAAPRRSRYLDDAEIGAAWRASGKLPTPHRQFYRMLMLTGLRLSEVREGEWSEFNFAAKEWTIPAARMKGKNGTAQEHIVPLTPHMLAVLSELSRGARGPFVFSVNGGLSPIAKNMKRKHLLDKAIAEDLGDRTKHFVNHDLRRTLRTRGRKLGIGADIGEAILAHRRVGVAGIYDHDDRLDERRKAHELWGEFLLQCAGNNVVRMQRIKPL